MAHPLAFSLENSQQQPVIYMGDSSHNQLTFTLANLSGHPLEFRAGQPVSEPSREGDSPSTLYLSFGSLLTTDEIRQIEWKAPGWTATFFDAGGIFNWGLSPEEDLTLAPNGQVQFQLDKIVTQHRPQSGFLTVDYYGVGQLVAGSNQLKLFLQNPPAKGRKNLQLNLAFQDGNAISLSNDYESPVVNDLTFILNNPDPTYPIVSNDKEWEADPPIFLLSFVEGEAPGYGSLTDLENAADIEVNPISASGTRWDVQPNLDPRNPVWRISPQSHEILGIGENSTVAFTISNIISKLEPGWTPMYLQWANLPGYNDGFKSIIIEKEPSLVIKELYTTPAFVDESQLPAEVLVKWQVANADSVELRYPLGSFNVTQKNSFLFPERTKYSWPITLHVEGANNQFIDQEIDFPVLSFKVDNQLFFDSIGSASNYFHAAFSPQWDRAYFISWQGEIVVIDTQQQQLIKKTKLNKGYLYPSGMAISTPLSKDSDRIYFFNGGENAVLAYDVNREGEFSLINTTFVAGPVNGALAVHPNGQRVYFNNGDGAICYYDLKDYERHCGPRGVLGESPNVDVMKIAPDGRWLYTANNKGVLRYDLVQQQSEPLLTNKEGGVHPYSLALSQDGTQLFIGDVLGKTVTVLFLEEDLRQTTIHLEDNANSLELSADGQVLYVLGHETISMLDIRALQIQYVLKILEVPQGTSGDLLSAAVDPAGGQFYFANGDDTFDIGRVSFKMTHRVLE